MLRAVQRKIKRVAGVVDRGQSQRRIAGIQSETAVGIEAPGHITGPVHPAERADTIGQRFGSPQGLGVCGEVPTKGYEVPLELVTGGIIPQHHLLAVAGEVEADK